MVLLHRYIMTIFLTSNDSIRVQYAVARFWHVNYKASFDIAHRYTAISGIALFSHWPIHAAQLLGANFTPRIGSLIICS